MFNIVGWGTDENTVISILGHRTSHQIQLIRKSYEDIYHEDLVKRLESEIKGDFEVHISNLVSKSILSIL